MSEERNNAYESLPDLSRPGNDGVLPADFSPWRLGINYTVHPELLSPVKSGREYRFIVSVLRRTLDPDKPGYADLYHRAAVSETVGLRVCNARTRMQPCIPGSSRMDGLRMRIRTWSGPS